ncbi:MAG: hypothetical protein ABUL72_06515, partial [Armatimonadota bacterium]
MSTPRPLRATTYLLRNAPKTLPLAGVIVLSVMLIAGIVSLIDSIPLSIRTIYSYSRYYIGITSRGDDEMIVKHKETLEKEAPVPIDRLMYVRGAEVEVKSIVGNWPFVVLALTEDDAHYYMGKMGVTSIDGRYPKDGEPEVIVSQPLAQNLHLQIGSVLLGPENTDAYSPNPVKVVG